VTVAVNVYVVPGLGAGSIEDPRRPKYFGPGGQYAGYPVAAIDYGREPVFLVAVRDVAPADHTTLAGLADVVTVPDLQQTVGAQAATVQARLEGLNIPGQWVTAGMSYGSVCRYVAVLCQIAQVLTQRLGRPRLFGGAVTLATRWNQLPQSVRDDLLALASELGMSTAALSGTTTVRQILKALADQWPAVAISFGGAVV
jgi:hypothetical protein